MGGATLHAMNPLYIFLSGAIFCGCAVVALFFLRFHRQTGDRLFLIFALSFAILAVERLMLFVALNVTEERALLYVPRLVAFLLILVAVVSKNRERAGD